MLSVFKGELSEASNSPHDCLVIHHAQAVCRLQNIPILNLLLQILCPSRPLSVIPGLLETLGVGQLAYVGVEDMYPNSAYTRSLFSGQLVRAS